MKKFLIAAVASLLCQGVMAATDSTGRMVPTGTFCANLGEYCAVNGKVTVNIAGCKSVNRYNGGCSTSKGVIVNGGGIQCTLANFGLKAPLPDVGPNSCYIQTLEQAGVDTSGAPKRLQTPPVPVTGAQCLPGGSATIVNKTIVVNGQAYDGQCKTFVAGVGLKRAAGEPADKPMFSVENGATLKNIVVGERKGEDDGIHVVNGGTLDNIRWNKFDDKAVTIKGGGKVAINNFSAVNGKDRLIQVEAPVTLSINNCIADNLRTLVNQDPGKPYKLIVFAERCKITNLAEAGFATGSPGSEMKLTKSYYRGVETLCKGPWLACSDVGNTMD
ncbi:MAG: pectate lyase [Rhodocyclaceae bacterium]